MQTKATLKLKQEHFNLLQYRFYLSIFLFKGLMYICNPQNAKSIGDSWLYIGKEIMVVVHKATYLFRQTYFRIQPTAL